MSKNKLTLVVLLCCTCEQGNMRTNQHLVALDGSLLNAKHRELIKSFIRPLGSMSDSIKTHLTVSYFQENKTLISLLQFRAIRRDCYVKIT